MEYSSVVNALIEVFEKSQQTLGSGAQFNVSKTVSTLAAIYEKARNAVEFRAEHLIRRAAIERILKRRVMLNGGSSSISENLVLELLWAKYIDSSLIYDNKIAEIQAIITKYLEARHILSSEGTTSLIPWDMLLGIASSEIEETIVSAKRREALSNFFYQAIRPNVGTPTGDEKTTNIQVFIAIERAFAQADDALIMYHLLKIMQPSWFEKTLNVSNELNVLTSTVAVIRENLSAKGSDSLYRYIRNHTPPFLLIRDFFLEVDGKAREIISDSKLLEEKLSSICAHKYMEIGTKIRRAVVRSIIYIFLTKMVFAFALEAPFDVFIQKHVDYLPLAINSLFPPLLLFLVAGFISVPGTDNTRRLIDRVKTILYHYDDLKNEKDSYEETTKDKGKRPVLGGIFSIFYITTFLISFGCISYILTSLHFSIASQIIFVFFVTLVTFFAYRIRQSAKEYEMIDRQGFLGPIVDFFFLPIIRVGHLLSQEIAKLNIFIFLFDFILEAPLKVIFEVVEEWIRFIRTKKEEII
ncbi:hypothetical protein HY947_03790 [Candidatus Gottesmanbacteria bacterium]|nr:hypothetical protein [Candidatus Gottesmanbacteria bacterium]